MMKRIFKFFARRISKSYQYYRRYNYFLLSNNEYFGNPIFNQPTLVIGLGKITFAENCSLGYFPSPYYYSGYIHLEAREIESEISIGQNVHINNNFVVISKSSVCIGSNVLIGTNVQIYDSDFHSIKKDRIGSKDFLNLPVRIGNNVWIGSNVTILKGVSIGDNSVIANGSIVTNSIKKNVVAGGIPAKTINEI